jgi:hypothetical protein
MTRVCWTLLFSLCSATAVGQVPIYPALPQPPAVSAYQQAFGQSFYQPPYAPGVPLPYGNAGYGYGVSGYGFGGYGLGGYGLGGYGLGGYGFGARGYYPPNPFGNLNWLPPNPPSPYYVTPSGDEYLEQVRRRDDTTYGELRLRHYFQNK